MIKRIVLTLLLAIVPVLASAQTTADRDVLLTPDGTLYTIESVFATDGDTIQTASSRYLLLTVQQGAHGTTMLVPGSVRAGLHYNPTLAYDADSSTLFMFWESAVNTTLNGTSLEFCSYQNGKWSDTTELDAARWRLRHNLRIEVTHKTEDRDTEGHPLFNELTVHAIWWEESGYGEWARYAMLTIDKGNVAHIQIHDLSDFVDARTATTYPTGAAYNVEVLRHPYVFESSTHDTVDVVFGDVTTHGMHRVTIRPVVDSRVRIPVGVRDHGFISPSFNGLSTSSPADLSIIAADRDRLVMYATTASQVSYAMLKDDAWTASRTITLTDKVNANVAVNAIRKMLGAD
jgi:hypothetical protein